jgi:hypothetical protein
VHSESPPLGEATMGDAGHGAKLPRRPDDGKRLRSDFGSSGCGGEDSSGGEGGGGGDVPGSGGSCKRSGSHQHKLTRRGNAEADALSQLQWWDAPSEPFASTNATELEARPAGGNSPESSNSCLSASDIMQLGEDAFLDSV